MTDAASQAVAALAGYYNTQLQVDGADSLTASYKAGQVQATGAVAFARQLVAASKAAGPLADADSLSPEEAAKVEEWLTLFLRRLNLAGPASAKDTPSEDFLQTLAAVNAGLVGGDFLAGGEKLTLADVFVFWGVAPWLGLLRTRQLMEYPCVTRWHNYLVSQARFAGLFPAATFPALKLSESGIFQFQFAQVGAAAPAAAAADEKKEAAPKQKQDGKADPKQKKQEAAADNKEAKQAKPAKAKAAKQPQAAPAKQPLGKRLKPVVATVLEVADHPEHPDKYYVMQLDCGEGKPRQVVGGLTKVITKEALLGSQVLCLVNIKAGEVKGVLSSGRCLTATNAQDPNHLEMVVPPAGSAPGDAVLIPGQDEPDACVSSKNLSNIWKGLCVNDKGELAFTQDGETWVYQTPKGAPMAKSIRSSPVA